FLPSNNFAAGSHQKRAPHLRLYFSENSISFRATRQTSARAIQNKPHPPSPPKLSTLCSIPANPRQRLPQSQSSVVPVPSGQPWQLRLDGGCRAGCTGTPTSVHEAVRSLLLPKRHCPPCWPQRRDFRAKLRCKRSSRARRPVAGLWEENPIEAPPARQWSGRQLSVRRLPIEIRLAPSSVTYHIRQTLQEFLVAAFYNCHDAFKQ